MTFPALFTPSCKVYSHWVLWFKTYSGHTDRYTSFHFKSTLAECLRPRSRPRMWSIKPQDHTHTHTYTVICMFRVKRRRRWLISKSSFNRRSYSWYFMIFRLVKIARFLRSINRTRQGSVSWSVQKPPWHTVLCRGTLLFYDRPTADMQRQNRCTSCTVCRYLGHWAGPGRLLGQTHSAADFRTVHSAFYFPHSAFYRDPRYLKPL